jgi:purine-nucleoside phosphorylase
MTPHIEANKGDYAPIVLMPGDPLRAKWIAEQFLVDVRQVNGVRNCLGYTGRFGEKEISVQASGMGQPSLGIYTHELFNFYDVESIIRVGSCGGISPKVKIGDIKIM